VLGVLSQQSRQAWHHDLGSELCLWCPELDFGHFWSVARLSREEFRQRDASTGLRPGMRRRARLNHA
jgi:hypothetical protein